MSEQKWRTAEPPKQDWYWYELVREGAPIPAYWSSSDRAWKTSSGWGAGTYSSCVGNWCEMSPPEPPELWSEEAIREMLLRDSHSLVKDSYCRKPHTCVRVRMLRLGPGFGETSYRSTSHIEGIGFSKWNVRDAGEPKWDWSKKRGHQIALGRAIKDLARRLAKVRRGQDE